MSEFCRRWGPLLGVLFITFFAFLPSLSNGFVNWDDTSHLLKNRLVDSLSPLNLKRIFTSVVDGEYMPLTILTFAIEHHFVGYQPFLYHLNNLLLHLAIVTLVFFWARGLGLSLLAASLTSLIFGIHPLHVESVAWVSERKDGLFGIFYMLSLLSYGSYLKSSRYRFLGLSVLCGFLSVLAKPMTLNLPFILLLLDWWHNRRWTLKSFVEKIPYALSIFPIVWITYVHVKRPPADSLGEGVLAWLWGLIFYVRKFFLPVGLSPCYQLPRPVTLLNAEHFMTILLLFLLAVILVRLRRSRWVVFSFFFYLCSMFYIFRFDTHDEQIVADHYFYISSLGFCILSAVILSNILESAWRSMAWKRWLGFLVVGVILGHLYFMTYRQCFAWRDSMSLWSYVIASYPDSATAFNNRGNVQKTYSAAIADYTKALQINPKFWEAYFNRGLLYEQVKEYALALRDLNRFLSAKPRDAEAYWVRGRIYRARKKIDLALADLNKALILSPRACPVYLERASLHADMGREDLSQRDLSKMKALGCQDNPF